MIRVEVRFFMKNLPLEDFNLLVEAVVICGMKEDSHLSDKQKVDRFDKFYDIIIQNLIDYGGFCKGGLDDSDFASSRYVDPTRKLVITSSISITEDICKSIVDKLKNLQGQHVVVFDAVGSQIAVFSSGQILSVN